jgi:hypothetical protein
MKYSSVTTRRLGDGERALKRPFPTTDNKNELRAYRDEIHAGIAALQSLDNLGSEQANQAAWDDMLELQKRYSQVVEKINELKSQ